MPARGVRVLVVCAAVAVGSLLAGCGDGRLRTYPVTGQVIYNSEPLKGVDVAFHPVDPRNDTGYPPHATTDDQGRFALWTYQDGDGAPAGEWKVAIAFGAPPPADDQEERDPTRTTRPRFQLPAKYTLKETTPFTVTVKPGTNDLEPFTLTGPPAPRGR